MSTSTPAFSFDRARYAGDPPPPESCAFCRRGLRSEYFRVNGQMACQTCALRVGSLLSRGSHTAFSRALVFGVAAAVVGCIGYALFEILTGIMLGWIALGVGFLVGWAMKKGSRGVGGRRYQVAAALLTYAAVAVAFIPVALHDSGHHRAASATSAQTSSQSATQPATQPSTAAATSPGSGPTPSAHPPRSFFLSVLTLLGLGLVSPFLILSASLGQGLLNLFILFLGVQMAWRQTATPRLTVEGPFEQTQPSTHAL